MKAPFGGGGGGGGGLGLHLFSFVVHLFDCPLPPYFFSYLGLVLSHSRLWTHMSRNSTLESLGLC